MTGYQKYNKDYNNRKKINILKELFPNLPDKKYDVIYADPPWDYGGKMQYDKSSIKSENINFDKDVFISSSSLIYPTLNLKELKTLNIQSISKENCLLFMWSTGPQLQNSIELGISWGFEYKTIAFVWDKQIHNPGRYTLSQCEYVLAFKKNKFPQPRGLRNIKQLFSKKRTKHSEKPFEILEYIHLMFPTQDKIELFARTKSEHFDAWGLEVENKSEYIISNYEKEK